MMKTKLFVIGITMFMCSCSLGDTKYIIFESDLDDLYSRVEKIEKYVNQLAANGEADEDELSELQSEIESLKGAMEDTFIDEGDVEPVHLRR